MPLTSIDDLKPAPYNPREIDAASAAALGVSLAEFGDISGLTWNARSGNLVAGHQRLAALKSAHGDGLRIDGGAVVTPGGERFPVRVVDWDSEKEKAANVAANSPHLAGRFTAELAPLLAEIGTALPELSAGLRLAELEIPGVFQVNEVAPPPLASGDRAPFQQMTFTLSDEQAQAVKSALDRAKSAAPFVETGNENSNGNALARIAEAYRGNS